MKGRKFDDQTDEDLVDLFSEWAKARGKAVIDCDAPAANRGYWKLDAVEKELHARGPLAHRKLLGLLGHSELLVRYYAAKRLLALEPGRARSIIEDVKAGPFDSLALDAGMTLRMLDDGTFKPT